MTQYTKFTKNITYNENYSNLPTTNGGLNTPLNHHNMTKTSSRGSNMTGLSATGSPALTLNTNNLPKPVLITNLNSSNISSLIKNERIKSSTIARSVTMRYNTNTKLQFENAYNNTSNNTSNANSGIINPNSIAANNNTSNLNGTTNLNGSNQSIQANHFHYNRRSLQQHGSPPQQHQQQSSASSNHHHQPHLSVDSSSSQQAKKEYLSLLSNIHRSQSIKLNRDKSNLSGYFSGLVSNRDSKQVNCSTLNNTSTNLSNLTSNSNSLAGGGGGGGGGGGSNNNPINYIQLNTSKYSRKHQPFSLRNNTYTNNTNTNNSNNSINLAGSNEANSYLLNSNTNNYTSNGLLTSSKHMTNSSNNRLSEISKNSISLDNVYNGLELIIANEHRSNKSNTNLAVNAYTSNLKKSTTSNSNQHYATTTTTTTTQSSNNSNPNYNYSNTNYLIDNSNRIINEFNLLKTNQISNSNNKKRIQKLDTDDEITHTTVNNNNNNNMTQEDQMITKDLSSSRSNHLKLNEASNENDENQNLDETADFTSKLHTTTTSVNENSLLKASNYFAKKVKPSKSEMRHAKMNDEQIYSTTTTTNSKLNKLDLMDQLDLYHQKPSNSINYLKAAAAVTKPLMTNASPGVLQANAHSPTNTRYLKTDMQRERTQIDYNTYTASNNMNMNSNIMNNSSKNLNNTTLESQSKLNYSRSQLTRNHSRLSHITRDINDSYAYTNVQQYIEENDLMPPEKAHSIRKWIVEVNNSYEEWEKKTVEKHIEDSFI